MWKSSCDTSVTLMLPRAAPAGGRHHLSVSVISSERQEVPLQVPLSPHSEKGRQHMEGTIFPGVITLVSTVPSSPLSLTQRFLTK